MNISTLQRGDGDVRRGGQPGHHWPLHGAGLGPRRHHQQASNRHARPRDWRSHRRQGVKPQLQQTGMNDIQ